MGKRNSDVVSASEIAAWPWCPESWRLDMLEVGRDDDGHINYGVAFHVSKAIFEKRSRSTITLGWWLLAVAALVAFLAIGLMVSPW